MEQEEPMLPEDDAFLLDFPLRQAVPANRNSLLPCRC